jgi:hypothetical protein
MEKVDESRENGKSMGVEGIVNRDGVCALSVAFCSTGVEGREKRNPKGCQRNQV